MKKILSLFVRDFSDATCPARPSITPGCEWVALGEGTASVKWDGTACLIRGGRIFRRYDCKRGKVPPDGFEPCQEPDEKTGHWPGWIPVGDGPADVHHRQAFAAAEYADGTYELVGPRINGNNDAFPALKLCRHGDTQLDAPREFEALRSYLRMLPHEGVVWRHPDGRMCKVKRSDFGFPWPRTGDRNG